MGPKYPKPTEPGESMPEPDLDPPEDEPGKMSRTQARDAFDPDWKNDEDKCY